MKPDRLVLLAAALIRVHGLSLLRRLDYERSHSRRN